MLANILLGFAFLASSEEGGGGLLSVNPGLAFWTVITFLLLLFLLSKFAWKPILSALTEREKQIEDSLKMADSAREEAKKMMEDNKVFIQKAEEEARKIVEKSREFAENMKNQIIEDSKNQAQKIIDNAKKESSRLQQEMFTELKNEIANISVDIAERIIKEKTDSQTNKVVIEKYLKEISKN